MNSVVARKREHYMDSKEVWGKPAEQVDAINGDRREDRRYHLQLELKWKLIRRRRVLDTGTGHTLDLSSGGIFSIRDAICPRASISNSPLRGRYCYTMWLPCNWWRLGKIVRCNGRQVAMQTTQHEFRTTGIPAENRTAIAGTLLRVHTHNPPMLSSAPMLAAFGRH